MNSFLHNYYLRLRGYAIVWVCVSVCRQDNLRKLSTVFDDFFQVSVFSHKEDAINFWELSGS